jgi:hypothetical protein
VPAGRGPKELSGDGTVVVGGAELGDVYYFLSIVPEPEPILAQGLISGPERSSSTWQKRTF